MSQIVVKKTKTENKKFINAERTSFTSVQVGLNLAQV